MQKGVMGIAGVLLLFMLSAVAFGQGVVHELHLAGGESAYLTCDGSESVVTANSITDTLVDCIAHTTTEPTAEPTTVSSPVAPYPSAPLCDTHDDRAYHGLWNSAEGCHYNHEHGTDAPAFVAARFGVNVANYTGGAISYPWQTPMENEHKHGGYKWDHRDGVTCKGRENSPLGVSAYAIQFHARGDRMALESRFHSSFAVIEICRVSNSTDRGTIIVGGHQDFGQNVSPYQGRVMTAYPNDPEPNYDPAREPYIAVDCVSSDCRRDLSNVTGNTTWISEPVNVEGTGNDLFAFLFRGRDTFDVVDGNTRHLYPPTFYYLCSSDGGATFNPAGCAKNNTTARVHEIMGTIPAAWDTLDGASDGHVTYSGHVDRWGNLITCDMPGPDCIPISLTNVPTGRYGMQDSGAGRTSPFSKEALPDRDICFGNGGAVIHCDQGGTPSGWPLVGN